MSKRKSLHGSDGCGYLLFVCLAACLMLAFNGLVVACLYSWFEPNLPPPLQHPRFAQTLMFVAPVVLLLVEWWLCDRRADKRQQRKAKELEQRRP